jgi:hypothetical protein
MTTHTRRALAALLLSTTLLHACDEDAPPSLCTAADQPSGHVTLSLSNAGGGMVAPGQQVLYDHGAGYMLLDDHCHYQAFKGGWSDHVVGQLSQAQADALMGRLDWSAWDQSHETLTEPGLSDGSTITIKTRDSSLSVYCAECAGAMQPARAAREIIVELAAQAGPQAIPDAVRYTAQRSEQTQHEQLAIPAAQLPEGWTPSPLSDEELNMPSGAQHPLLTDAAVIDALWTLRAQHVALSESQWVYGYIPVLDAQGQRYNLHLRRDRALFTDLP